MLFKFLKYLHPTHYFQLVRNNGKSIFPVTILLPDEVKTHLHLDTNFKSILAQQYDLSWQAIFSGYIGDVDCYMTFENLPIIDEYHFIRKYFSKFWVFYVLLVRILSFKNPYLEFKSWYATRKTKRLSLESHSILYGEWDNFTSNLIVESPKVSVIIPTLNRYDYLKEVLQDLEKQTYTNFEVIIVDQSEPYYPGFYQNFELNINLIRQEEKALWLARNSAIQRSRGQLIALSEDDVLIKPDWIESHLKCLDFFSASISAGVFYPLNQSLPKSRSYFAIASQFATGNAMLYKDIFKDAGLFDRQFEGQRMGDGEFGLRAFLLGLKSVSNPYAACVDVKAGTGGLRYMGSWDAFRPTNLLAPRPIPSVLYFYRTYFGDNRSLWALLKTVPLSIMPYGFKNNKFMILIGIFVSIVLLPFVLYQVYKSWRLATLKIEKGELIPSMN